MMTRVRAVGSYLAALARSPTVWKGLGAIAAFWLAAWLFDFLPLYAMTSIILLVVSIGVLLMYLPGFLESLVAGRLAHGERLVLGIWVAWAGDIMLRLWALTQRALDQPEWMLTSDIVSFIIFIKLMGAALHLTSPGSVEGKVPPSSWVWLTLGIVLGALTAAALLATTVGVDLIGPK